MELLVGPNFTIDVPSSPPLPAYGGDHPNADADADERAVPYALFDGGSDYRLGGKPEFFAVESSESSSSIGTPDDSDNENGDVSGEVKEEEEVQSKLKGSTSLDSLEDSLPIEKGLSSHFIGKSKSFTDLSQVSNVKELQKQENPFNKRRRVLIASKWSRRSFYSWSNPKSMPLLPVDEDEDDDYDDDDVEEDKARKVSPSSSLEEEKPENQIKLREVNNRVPQSYAAHMRLRLGSFKSRSFSLADLQEHEEEEEEDNYD